METKVITFRDLKVWKKAHELVLHIYTVSNSFPREELFGLTSQLRRSVVSVPTNIVEGNKRKGIKDYLHFLNVSVSSLEETKYLVLLSKDLQYIDDNDYLKINERCNEVGKMVNGLQKSLKKKYNQFFKKQNKAVVFCVFCFYLSLISYPLPLNHEGEKLC